MTKLFLNQLYFINSLIKKNSKKVQDLSFISTQQPSELLYKGGSHNHSCPAPKEFQPQKKLSVGPPSREGLNYTKNPCFFPSTEGLWSEINVRSCLLKLLELFPYLSLGRRLVLTPRARHRARARVQLLPEEQGAPRPPGCSNPSSSTSLLSLTPTPPADWAAGQPPAPHPTSYRYSLPVSCLQNQVQFISTSYRTELAYFETFFSSMSRVMGFALHPTKPHTQNAIKYSQSFLHPNDLLFNLGLLYCPDYFS